jgi:hypothetical protein
MRSAAAVQVQAMLPHVVAVGMVAVSLSYLSGARRMGFWQVNVVLTGVVFPLIDLGLGVGAYWFADNDYFFLFGPGTLTVRATLTLWFLVLIGLSALVLLRRRNGAGEPAKDGLTNARHNAVSNVRS